jgi:hypothetical protein
MPSFNQVWEFLQINLNPGTQVLNWTAHKGYLGDSMIISSVYSDAVEIDAPGAKNIQVVSRQDFEIVWQVWEKYKGFKTQRQEIRDQTRYSKYIISIFHWYEGHNTQ